MLIEIFITHFLFNFEDDFLHYELIIWTNIIKVFAGEKNYIKIPITIFIEGGLDQFIQYTDDIFVMTKGVDLDTMIIIPRIEPESLPD